MSSIDDLFKLSTGHDVKTNGQITDDDEEQDDIVAGPELPPDQDEAVDEEGRFFGGGITANTANALDFIDERDEENAGKPEKFDAAWVRKLALNFERKISKNSELRAKFEDDPQKFMSSEADLDTEVKALSLLSDHPDLYDEFVKLGCVRSLVSLLSHENTDIAIDAIEIINELTDEDVEAEQQQWDSLVNAMLDVDLLNLLFENISRLDESLESDRAGIYHILSVVENLSSRPSIASSIFQHTSFLSWLLKRIEAKEPTITQNKQYAAEILAILLQSSPSNQSHFIGMNGIDSLLILLSPYRKTDPSKGTEEEEYVENLFDCLTCVVDTSTGKHQFLQYEGPELCLIMLREGKMSKSRALCVLDHALGGGSDGAAACCERLVEAAGLKATFAILTKTKQKLDRETTEHILGILASLLRSLPADSAARIRLLAKFVERDYQALSRLVGIRRDCMSRLRPVDEEITFERASLDATQQEDRGDEWLSRRLDTGLYSLQTTDVILSWLVAEDEGAAGKIKVLLAERDESLADVKATLKEQLAGMESNAETADADAVVADMLGTLIGFL
ncbi:MAG: hypothetical protein LQ351_000950 [Letrouitia transgressa]|nr:MAG: hypothetical protein LQ351_000950 [Letrouitia transgressa]